MEKKSIFTTKGREAAEKLLQDNGEEEEQEQLVVDLRIGEAIRKRGLTQKQVAEMTGIRPSTISDLARGSGFVDRVNIHHLGKIANVLGITDIRELIELDLESEVWNMGTRFRVREIEEALEIKDEE
jgi:transcriptional regulator with XRE-family HTH domain